MEIVGPDGEPTLRRKRTGDDGGQDRSAAHGDVATNVLEELERRWEERYFEHAEDNLDALGIEDPLLLKALRQRVAQRKRLYAFLGISSDRKAMPRASGSDDALEIPNDRAKHAVIEPSEEPFAAAAPPAIPHSIGRYAVMRILGRGGFGTVYLAPTPGWTVQSQSKCRTVTRRRT